MRRKLSPHMLYGPSCVMLALIVLLACAGCGPKESGGSGANSASSPLKVGIIPFEDMGLNLPSLDQQKKTK